MSTPNRKTALITGAAGGIGRSLVKVFHDAGYDVVATDITEKPSDLHCTGYQKADLARYAQD
ncbi:MAG: SDR family NAD(P)-dependent oxidoreductase, partial [Candidatus Accumulibacter sp.]|nr:SDR family NAD(P)-dependent oxidoreductase [Accumulibacter sp.]